MNGMATEHAPMGGVFTHAHMVHLKQALGDDWTTVFAELNKIVADNPNMPCKQKFHNIQAAVAIQQAADRQVPLDDIREACIRSECGAAWGRFVTRSATVPVRYV